MPDRQQNPYGGETVSWMFNENGLIEYPTAVADEDTLMEAAIEAGAEDVVIDETYEVLTAVTDFGAVKAALEEKFGKPEEADLTFIATQQQPVTDHETAEKLLKLITTLEDDDDVQTVITNADMDAAIAAKLAS